MAKIGRPFAEKPKDKRFSICMDLETEQMLNEYCERENVSKGEAVRRGLKLLLKKKKK